MLKRDSDSVIQCLYSTNVQDNSYFSDEEEFLYIKNII